MPQDTKLTMSLSAWRSLSQNVVLDATGRSSLLLLETVNKSSASCSLLYQVARSAAGQICVFRAVGPVGVHEVLFFSKSTGLKKRTERVTIASRDTKPSVR